MGGAAQWRTRAEAFLAGAAAPVAEVRAWVGIGSGWLGGAKGGFAAGPRGRRRPRGRRTQDGVDRRDRAGFGGDTCDRDPNPTGRASGPGPKLDPAHRAQVHAETTPANHSAGVVLQVSSCQRAPAPPDQVHGHDRRSPAAHGHRQPRQSPAAAANRGRRPRTRLALARGRTRWSSPSHELRRARQGDARAPLPSGCVTHG